MEATLEKLMIRIAPHRAVQWGIVLGFSLLFLAALEALDIPAGLLLGPMIAGILFAAAGGSIRVPAPLYGTAQALIGAMIASALPFSHLGNILTNWPVLLLGVGSTIIAAATIGFVLARGRVLPGTTAIWGSSPGAASTMVVMAEVFGADVRLVAFMQYLRVMCVAGLASLTASITMTTSGHAPNPIDWFPAFDGVSFVLTLAVAFGSGLAAHLLKIPAGGLLTPMVACILASEAGLTIVLPPWLLAIAYALFGWTIGLRFTRAVFLHAARALPRLLGAIFLLIAICAGFGFALSAFAGIDPLTAYLATSPGGADSVAIIAASAPVDVGFVMTMQMARFLVVTATGPALAKLLAGKVTS
ncbi:hypothetical protein FHS83_000974 [Rhizomicrobium palustre]|uniref:Ammonia monooxygenase n=1 Tax=Rhizomicrobium palustre TaxID=189966 RepID=A0A846MW89_9PROT|nr:AbrB family transcriptional regulator [Rhizomicrobium palustre]NIK87656.1 hypothetical protein [Rhizomicrobium palustre]